MRGIVELVTTTFLAMALALILKASDLDLELSMYFFGTLIVMLIADKKENKQ